MNSMLLNETINQRHADLRAGTTSDRGGRRSRRFSEQAVDARPSERRFTRRPARAFRTWLAAGEL